MDIQVVSITDAKLTSMANDPAMRREFPFLGTAWLQATSTAKKSCCGKKNKATRLNFAELKQAIADMPVERKAKLKQLLGNPRQVEIVYSTGTGKPRRLRF